MKLFLCVSIVATFSRVLALSDEDIIQRFMAIEAKERTFREEIASLKAELKHQQDSLDLQEQIIQSMSNELYTLKTRNLEHFSVKSKNNSTLLEPKKSKQKSHRRTARQASVSEGVAFTAYLDHSVTFGQSQTIKFNNVITNEGNGYSVHTGAFTCPLSGMYLFTFEIGERGTGADLAADIVVNSQIMVDAVIDPYHDGQDLMGGNTVVVRLNQGDAVWVSARHASSHTDSSKDYRRTTFTGVYLFA